MNQVVGKNMVRKTCFRCRRSKRLSEFYRHSGMADGHLNKCKVCTRADVSANRLLKFEYYSQFDRSRAMNPDRVAARADYLKTAKGQEAATRAKKWWAILNPEKRAAHIAVGNAIRAGKLSRQSCEVCGSRAHAHHPDYSKPLTVCWLCPVHHSRVHKVVRVVA